MGDPQVNLPGCSSLRPDQHGTGTGRKSSKRSVEGERRGGGGGGGGEGVVMGDGEGVRWGGCEEEEEEESLSQYESARGTQGRGTPPARGRGQPRLDQLFQQLHARQVGGGASGRGGA